MFEDEGRLYATDKDVLPAATGDSQNPPLFGLVVGKVPAPPCVRGRFWNCAHLTVHAHAFAAQTSLGPKFRGRCI